MNTFVKNLEKETQKGFTENGDICYTTLGSKVLDFFSNSSNISGSIEDLKDIQIKFEEACKENKDLALRALVYLRDIKDGAGRREAFRACLNKLSSMGDSENVEKIVNHLSEFGRYDDMLNLLFTNDKEIIINHIKKVLTEDLNSEGTISLLAKWLPSLSSKNSIIRKQALILSDSLYNGNKKLYRQTISKLRKKIGILETKLSNKEYDFEYKNVPARALKKYHRAFFRNDLERYEEFKNKVISGELKEVIQKRADNLYLYEILDKIIAKDEVEKELYKAMWKDMDRKEVKKKILVVRDGSGSMQSPVFLGRQQAPSCQLVADSITLFCSEMLTGDFKDRFITFSENPKFVDLSSVEDIESKYNILKGESEVSNTDIEKTYYLILEAMKKSPAEDHPDIVLILSDMQFDDGTEDMPDGTYQKMKNEFKEANIKIPKMVYWNLDDYLGGGKTYTSQDFENCLFVSGFSKSVFNDIIKYGDYNYEEYVSHVLSRYDYIFE